MLRSNAGGRCRVIGAVAPQPRHPSCDDYGPPDGYKLAYTVPCTNPYQHLPKEAPRVHDAPVHVAAHVTPKWRVLPPLQVRVPYDQHGSQNSGHESSEHGPGEPLTPHQAGGNYRATDVSSKFRRMDLVVEHLLVEVHRCCSSFPTRSSGWSTAYTAG